VKDVEPVQRKLPEPLPKFADVQYSVAAGTEYGPHVGEAPAVPGVVDAKEYGEGVAVGVEAKACRCPLVLKAILARKPPARMKPTMTLWTNRNFMSWSPSFL
jgi:hypothetical protein